MRFFNKYFFIGLGSGAVLTIALIFLAGYILFMRTMPSPEKIEAILRPPEFPNDQQVSVYEQTDRWSIRTLEGAEVGLSQFKGKVVFLNFWATWCKPCINEMPSIQNLYDYLSRHVGQLNPDCIASHIADDGTRKMLLRMPDGKEMKQPVGSVCFQVKKNAYNLYDRLQVL